jgi:putative membrane protein
MFEMSPPFMLLGLVGNLILWVGLALLVVWAVRAFAGRTPLAPVAAPPLLTPRQILDERLARGEVTVEEYEKTRKVLDKQ